MREILVISGKGGTGKTSLTAAFAHLAKDKIICDLDVDAPDMHILLDPEKVRTERFLSGNEAVIDPGRCAACGLCEEMCRFGAVRAGEETYFIDPLRCEGCKVCVTFCPERAIDFPVKHCGEWYVSRTRFGTMVHAQLFPGEENSGRLVTLLKKEARELAKAEGARLVLCDGTPGIGCPVISSLSGVHLAVVVTEPTPSGRHDFERVAQLCDHFRTRVAVVVNKWDLNPEETERIEAVCRERRYELLARLPHDDAVPRSMVELRTVTEFPETDFARSVRDAWARLETLAGPGE